MNNVPLRLILTSCFYLSLLSVHLFGIPAVEGELWNAGEFRGEDPIFHNNGARSQGRRDADQDSLTDDSSLQQRGALATRLEQQPSTLKEGPSEREDFLSLLDKDHEQFSKQLAAIEIIKQREMPILPEKEQRTIRKVQFSSKEEVPVSQIAEEVEQRKLRQCLFLKKMIEVINRLRAKYSSLNSGEEMSVIMIPSLSVEKAQCINAGVDSYFLKEEPFWQKRQMTELAADQEYYQAFKEKEVAALAFLKFNYPDEALYYHEIALKLDRLAQHFNPSKKKEEQDLSDDEDEPESILIDQQLVTLSFFLNVLKDLKDMTEDENKGEYLLFQIIQEIQQELQSGTNICLEKNRKLLWLVQQYRQGVFDKDPQHFLASFNKWQQQFASQSQNCPNDHLVKLGNEAGCSLCYLDNKSIFFSVAFLAACGLFIYSLYACSVPEDEH